MWSKSGDRGGVWSRDEQGAGHPQTEKGSAKTGASPEPQPSCLCGKVRGEAGEGEVVAQDLTIENQRRSGRPDSGGYV